MNPSRHAIVLSLSLLAAAAHATPPSPVYTNPILHAGYSDPT